MKKKTLKLKAKFALNKEMVAQLNLQEQAAIAGGAATVTSCRTLRTCPPQHTAFVSCEGIC